VLYFHSKFRPTNKELLMPGLWFCFAIVSQNYWYNPQKSLKLEAYNTTSRGFHRLSVFWLGKYSVNSSPKLDRRADRTMTKPITLCHHVAFRGSLELHQAISSPNASRNARRGSNPLNSNVGSNLNCCYGIRVIFRTVLHI
jgi:hypothetical protein